MPHSRRSTWLLLACVAAVAHAEDAAGDAAQRAASERAAPAPGEHGDRADEGAGGRRADDDRGAGAASAAGDAAVDAPPVDAAAAARAAAERARVLAVEAKALANAARAKAREAERAAAEARTLAAPRADGAAAPEQALHERRDEVRPTGLLVPRGHLEVEPSLTYVSITSDNLLINGFTLAPVLVVGDIHSERVRRDIGVASAAFSYGLLDDLQLEVEVPYRYRVDTFIASDNTMRRAHGEGLSDVRGGATAQVWRNRGGWVPDLLLNAAAYAPTGRDPFDYDPQHPRGADVPLGSGLWGLGASLTALKASDPAVLFASLTGSDPLDRQAHGRMVNGLVKAGAGVGYAVGLAVALNYQLTINFQVQQSYTFPTSIDHVMLHDSSIDDARFAVGGAWAFGTRSTVRFQVATGLTRDAPDLVVRASLPIRW